MIEIKRLNSTDVSKMSNEFEQDLWGVFKILQDDMLENIIKKVESPDGLTPEELDKEIEGYFI
jgi:hypothetical protein